MDYTKSYILLIPLTSFLSAATSFSSLIARRPLQRVDKLPLSIAVVPSPLFREVIYNIPQHSNFNIIVAVSVVVIEVVHRLIIRAS